MSLPEPAAIKARRRSKSADTGANPSTSNKPLKQGSGVKNEAPLPRALDAANLAKELENGLAEGRLDVLTPEALQALMAALCKTYAANIEAGRVFPIVGSVSAITSTDVMVSCAALLKATNLQVFELGMWQSWTGR